MSARLVAAFAAVLAIGGLGGCTAGEGQKVVGYSGKASNWTKAPENGRYTLQGVSGQRVTYFVEKGERIGFRRSRDDDQAVVAIAGSNAPVRLERGEARKAYWKFSQKEAE